MTNPYNILNLTAKASLAEIKSSYRLLIKKYHPDKTNDSKASKFKYDQIRQAYDILSDSKTKRFYDLGLIDGTGKKISRSSIKPNFKNASQSVNSSNTSPFSNASYSSQKDVYRKSNKDFFSFLKNDNIKNSDKYNNNPIKSNISYHLNLSEAEAKNGCKKIISLANNKKLKVKIPANSISNDKLRIKNVVIGNIFNKKNTSEIIIHLNVVNKQLKPYKTDGKDVYIRLPVSIYEAINGAKINLATHGGEVVVSIDKLTSSNTKLRIKGKGLQAKAGELNGDLYLDIKIVMPKTLPKELIDIIKKYPNYGDQLRN